MLRSVEPSSRYVCMCKHIPPHSKHPEHPQTLKTAKVQVVNISTQNLKGWSRMRADGWGWCRLLLLPAWVGVRLGPSRLGQVELNYWFHDQSESCGFKFVLRKPPKFPKGVSHLKKKKKKGSCLKQRGFRVSVFKFLTCCWYILLSLWSRSWPAGRFLSQISDYLD